MSSWVDKALCRSLFVRPQWWDLALDNNARMSEDNAEAIRICGTCDVQPECLAHAINTNELYGIWGGTTPQQRLGATR